MDLRVLRYFIVAVEAKSINEASRQLYVTQPTLTRQFHELEEEVGHKLFERSKNGIKPTEKGLLLYQRAVEVLDMVSRMKKEIKTSDKLEGVISFAAAETPTMLNIAKVMHEFNQKNPFVYFDLMTAIRQHALNYIENGICELALTVHMPDPSFAFLKIHDKNRFGIYTLKGSVLSQKQKICPQDLRGLPMIMSKTMFQDKALEGWLGFPPINLRIAATCDFINNAVMLVKSSLGHIIAFDGLIGDHSDFNNDVVFVPFEPTLYSESYIVWKKDRMLSQPARIFLDELKAGLKISDKNEART